MLRAGTVQPSEQAYFLRLLRYLFCSIASVQFYDVRVGGHRTALTRPQITGLFEAGQLGGNDLCKEVERAEWRTIDELFPLLKQGTTSRSLYQPVELHNSRVHVIRLTVGISIFVISTALVVGYFAFRNGPSGSGNGITAKAAANPAVPVSYTIENPYLVSPKARAEQERLKAARRAREQAEAARLAQERADAEKRERELQTAANKTERAPTQQRPRVAPVSPGASQKPRK